MKWNEIKKGAKIEISWNWYVLGVIDVKAEMLRMYGALRKEIHRLVGLIPEPVWHRFFRIRGEKPVNHVRG